MGDSTTQLAQPHFGTSKAREHSQPRFGVEIFASGLEDVFLLPLRN
jgi:hypothetical protein